MKRLLFLLLFLTASMIMASTMAVDRSGNIYHVQTAQTDDLFYLTLNVTTPDGESTQSIIPSTYDNRQDEDPYLTIIPEFRKLYITWSFGDGDYRNIALASYDIADASWSDPILLSGKTLVKRFHSKSILTKNADGTGFLHVIWWVEYDESYGDTAYCVIPLGQDDLNYADRAIFFMQSYVDNEESSVSTFPPSAYRYPNIHQVGEGNGVVILDPSPQNGVYYLIHFDFDTPVDGTIEEDERAHFPDIGVRSSITMNAALETESTVDSLTTPNGNSIFYWSTENGISYLLYCNGLWSPQHSAPLNGVDPERIKTLFTAIIR